MGRLNAKFLGASFAQENPAGTVDGTNVSFTLANAPVSSNALVVSIDGLIQTQGAAADYTLSGTTITFLTAPAAGSTIQASYMRVN